MQKKSSKGIGAFGILDNEQSGAMQAAGDLPNNIFNFLSNFVETFDYLNKGFQKPCLIELKDILDSLSAEEQGIEVGFLKKAEMAGKGKIK